MPRFVAIKIWPLCQLSSYCTSAPNPPSSALCVNSELDPPDLPLLPAGATSGSASRGSSAGGRGCSVCARGLIPTGLSRRVERRWRSSPVSSASPQRQLLGECHGNSMRCSHRKLSLTVASAPWAPAEVSNGLLTL